MQVPYSVFRIPYSVFRIPYSVFRIPYSVFPSASSYTNKEHQFPIQSAVWHREAIPCVPVLANEGDRLNVGGEGQRGGLLLEDPGAGDRISQASLWQWIHKCDAATR